MARAALIGNEKCSKTDGRSWPLSGGILRCPDCGRALVAVTAKKAQKDGTRRHHYYHRCATRRRRGIEACTFGRTASADKTGAEVWEAVRSVVLDPARLRKMLRDHQEAQKRRTATPTRRPRGWPPSWPTASARGRRTRRCSGPTP